MTDTPDPELDAMARAIAATTWPGEGSERTPWESYSKYVREMFLREAAAARNASRSWMKENGMVVVPREPTDEVLAVEITPLLVAGSAQDSRVLKWREALYRAMITAATKDTP